MAQWLARTASEDDGPAAGAPTDEHVVHHERGCVAVAPEDRMTALMRPAELDVRIDRVAVPHARDERVAEGERLPHAVVPLLTVRHDVLSTRTDRGMPFGIFSMSSCRFSIRSRHMLAVRPGVGT